MSKEKVAGTYFTINCDKCKIGMERWIKSPITQKWIWKCPKCGETEND